MHYEAARRIKEGVAHQEIKLEIDLDRPWGGYITLGRNEYCTPKILVVQDDLSVQSHQLRDEVWMLLSGQAAAYRGPIAETPRETIAGLKETIMMPGDVISIPRGTVHTVTRIGEQHAIIAELARGEALENDIIRYYDKHRRATLDGFPSGISIKEIIQLCSGHVK